MARYTPVNQGSGGRFSSIRPQPRQPGAPGETGGEGAEPGTGSLESGTLPSVSTNVAGVNLSANPFGAQANLGPVSAGLSSFGKAGINASPTDNPIINTIVQNVLNNVMNIPTAVNLLSMISPALAGVLGPAGAMYGAVTGIGKIGEAIAARLGIPTVKSGMEAFAQPESGLTFEQAINEANQSFAQANQGVSPTPLSPTTAAFVTANPGLFGLNPHSSDSLSQGLFHSENGPIPGIRGGTPAGGPIGPPNPAQALPFSPIFSFNRTDEPPSPTAPTGPPPGITGPPGLDDGGMGGVPSGPPGNPAGVGVPGIDDGGMGGLTGPAPTAPTEGNTGNTGTSGDDGDGDGDGGDGYAKGGRIPGKGRKYIKAHGGEFVIDRNTSRANLSLLQALNSSSGQISLGQLHRAMRARKGRY